MKRALVVRVILAAMLVFGATAVAAEKKIVSGGGAAPTPAKVYKDKITGMEFVFVKGGCFQMGDFAGSGRKDESPVHQVCVGDFYLGKYEVTREQWQKVAGALPEGNGHCTAYNCPVENLGWQEAVDFIRDFKAKSKSDYRLPTEAEWEYAARSGGKAEKYAGGDDLDAVAWYAGNSKDVPHPVGLKKPNGLGLYDMTGNVMEWCSDYYGEGYYAERIENNPQGPASGENRSQRGGHYGDDDLMQLRNSNRGYDTPEHHNGERYGVRVVKPVR